MSEFCCDENIFGVDVNEDKLNLFLYLLCVFYYNYNVYYEDVNKCEDKGNVKL